MSKDEAWFSCEAKGTAKAHREVFMAVIAWMLKWEIRIPDPAKGRFAGMELEATLKKLVPDRTVDAGLLKACRAILETAIAKAEGK